MWLACARTPDPPDHPPPLPRAPPPAACSLVAMKSILLFAFIVVASAGAALRVPQRELAQEVAGAEDAGVLADVAHPVCHGCVASAGELPPICVKPNHVCTGGVNGADNGKTCVEGENGHYFCE